MSLRTDAVNSALENIDSAKELVGGGEIDDRTASVNALIAIAQLLYAQTLPVVTEANQ